MQEVETREEDHTEADLFRLVHHDMRKPPVVNRDGWSTGMGHFQCCMNAGDVIPQRAKTYENRHCYWLMLRMGTCKECW